MCIIALYTEETPDANIFDTSNKLKQILVTGWTNVNLLYSPDSIDIASLQELTLWSSEINYQSQDFLRLSLPTLYQSLQEAFP